MRQFMRENWFLAVGRNPVQHRNCFGLRIVVGRNSVACGLHQEFLQVEIPGEEAELLHAQLFLRKPFRKFFFRHCPVAYVSTSALPTSLRLTAACCGMPVSSAAKAKILSTDSNRFLVSASVILTSLVVSLRSLRATSPRL